ncbi:hypothetical protein [Parasphingorhabdus pacifica]
MTIRLTPTQGLLRALRGVGLAITSASLSVAAHTAAGGSLPEPGMTTVITLLLAGTGVALANRKRGPKHIVGALLVAQCALHQSLQVTGSNGHPGHAAAPFDTATMTFGHIAVAVLTGLVLARAEHALFVVATFLGMILPRRHSPLPVATSLRTICIPARTVRGTAEILYQRIHSRRGPPALSC